MVPLQSLIARRLADISLFRQNVTIGIPEPQVMMSHGISSTIRKTCGEWGITVLPPPPFRDPLLMTSGMAIPNHLSHYMH